MSSALLRLRVPQLMGIVRLRGGKAKYAWNLTANPGRAYASLHPPRLQDKVALITGASSGLGRAIALQFASHGTSLVVCADLHREPRSSEDETVLGATDDIVRSFYGQNTAEYVQMDVNSSEDVKQAMKVTVSKAGRLDILVNCAGLGNVSGSPLAHELREEDWDRVINVNLRGTFITNKYALQQMMRQEPRSLASVSTSTKAPPGTVARTEMKEGSHFGLNRRGTIINVSSMLGSVALPDGTAAYCASKGGVLNLTRQLALDYAPYLININALCPGFLTTAMTAGNRRDPVPDNSGNTKLEVSGPVYSAEQTGDRMRCSTPFGEWGRVEDVARMAVSLASEDAGWMTGAEVVVDGGYSAGGYGGVAATSDPRVLRARHQQTFGS